MIKILHERVSNRRNEYEAYLKQHINGVKKAYEQFKDVLLTESDLTVEDITMLDRQIELHDASKYEDEEFYPYLYHFYPSQLELIMKMRMIKLGIIIKKEILIIGSIGFYKKILESKYFLICLKIM